MPRPSRLLKVFLAYSLLWPISFGDKMVQLAVATDSPPACSSPWVLYREVAGSLRRLEGANASRDSGSRLQAPVPPSGLLLPCQKPGPAKKPLPALRRHRRAPELPSAGTVAWHRTDVPPPSPVVPFHLDSKK